MHAVSESDFKFCLFAEADRVPPAVPVYAASKEEDACIPWVSEEENLALVTSVTSVEIGTIQRRLALAQR